MIFQGFEKEFSFQTDKFSLKKKTKQGATAFLQIHRITGGQMFEIWSCMLLIEFNSLLEL